MAWLAGIAIGQRADLPGWFWMLGVVLGLTAVWIGPSEAAGLATRPDAPASSSPLTLTGLASRFSLRRIGPYLTLAALGALRYSLSVSPIEPPQIASYNDLHQPLSVTGLVVDFPDVRDEYIGLRVMVDQVGLVSTGELRPAEGRVLVQADRYGDYQYGDRIEAAGFLETPPEYEDFSYRDYLARQGVLSLMSRASVVRLADHQGSPLLTLIFGLRQRAFDTIHSLFPDPEASLLAGILLGIESGISPEVRDTFNATSTTHIIAISGFNLTVLAALVIRLFGRWLGIRRGAVAAAVTISLYTVLVGADAAVVRAAIMGGLALFARYLGRRADGLASLSAAAVLMTAVQPQVLWDVGFQLSFAATLGLVLYADPIQARFVQLASRWVSSARAEQLAGPVGEYLLFTLAAQATTLPLTMTYFRRLSLSSLLANPVILPAQPPLMILGGIATIAGMILPALGKLLALVAWPFPAFTIRAVAFFAALPASSLVLSQVTIPTVVLLYALLFGATWLVAQPAERRFQLPRPSMGMLVLGLMVATAITWRALASRPDGRTHLTLFNSGSRLIQTASGRYLLIGGGDSAIELSQQLGRRMPLLHRQIDWLILPNTSEPRLRGLIDLTDRYQIHGALLPSLNGGTAFRSVLAELQAAGVELVQPEPGRRLQLGDNSWLVVLDRSDSRLSLLLTVGSARFGLLADSDPLSERPLPDLNRVSALAIHDPDPSDWLAEFQPWLAVATGHTSDLTAWPLRTEQQGWIELVTDGQQLWVQSQYPATLSQPPTSLPLTSN